MNWLKIWIPMLEMKEIFWKENLGDLEFFHPSKTVEIFLDLEALRLKLGERFLSLNINFIVHLHYPLSLSTCHIFMFFFTLFHSGQPLLFYPWLFTIFVLDFLQIWYQYRILIIQLFLRFFFTYLNFKYNIQNKTRLMTSFFFSIISNKY